MKYAFIGAHKREFRMFRVCGVLEVSRNGYYDWQARPEPKRTERNRALLREIRKIHEQSHKAYRAIKTWHSLQQSGIVWTKYRVAELRRIAGIERLHINPVRL